MIKLLLAILSAIILSTITTTTWFLSFGPNSLSGIGQSFMDISRGAEFWLGIGIFTVIYFIFLTLPLTLILTKE